MYGIPSFLQIAETFSAISITISVSTTQACDEEKIIGIVLLLAKKVA